MNTNNDHAENINNATSTTPNNEGDQGRYSERVEGSEPTPSASDTNQVDQKLEASLSANSEYISKELGELYAGIEQHVTNQITHIEQANNNINELINNLNKELQNSLNK